MVLKDSFFEHQTIQTFIDVAMPKYFGTLNLDNVTRHLPHNHLKWFVGFSSITAGSGNAGQTNYGWANSAMERIIEQRRADGYPGIAIQWGAVGDVGVVQENLGDNNTIVGGTLPQRIPSCLASLDVILSTNHPVVASYVKAEVNRKIIKKKESLMGSIGAIFGVGEDVSSLGADVKFSDLGIDSLMGFEIKQALEEHNIVLPIKDIKNVRDINKAIGIIKNPIGVS